MRSITTVGCIGAGNMGSALLEGMVAKGAIPARDIIVSDHHRETCERLAGLGMRIGEDTLDVALEADIVIIAVKPKDVMETLKHIRTALTEKALLSIAAGVTYQTLREALHETTRVLVTLPNTPARVGAGVTAFTQETTFTSDEQALCVRLFEAVGMVVWAPEKLLAVVSALSGSGPAYAALFMEALADGAVLGGLSRQTAYRLAAQTLKGAGTLLLDTGCIPAAIKDAVCSPGGTTISGVQALEQGGFRAAVINAVSQSTRAFFHIL